jgi:hypothetical protein
MAGAPGTPGTGHRFIVDHFEGDLVVVEMEGGPLLDLPRWMLPPGVGEGDVVVGSVTATGPGSVTLLLAVDAEASRARRDQAAARIQALRGGDPGGDIIL